MDSDVAATTVQSNSNYLQREIGKLKEAANTAKNDIKKISSKYSSTTKIPSREPKILETIMSYSETLFKKICDEIDSINSVKENFETMEEFLTEASVDLNMTLESGNVNITELGNYEAIDVDELLSNLSSYGLDVSNDTSHLHDGSDEEYYADDGDYYEYTGQTVVDSENLSNYLTSENNEQSSDDVSTVSYNSETTSSNDYVEEVDNYIDEDEDLYLEDDFDDYTDEDLFDTISQEINTSSVTTDLVDEVGTTITKSKKSSVGKIVAGVAAVGAGAGGYVLYKKKKENDEF